MVIPKEWFGKTLIQLDLRKKYDINIITIKRGDKVFIPQANAPFTDGDIVFVIGEINDILKCFRI